MVNEDGLKLPPALRMAANSGRGRKLTALNEEDALQLPSALRMAANSDRGKSPKKRDERMSLKNEARAIRLRLAQMDEKIDRVQAVENIRIDTTLTCPEPDPSTIQGKGFVSLGNYSSEVLNKKIKKAERMLRKSSPESKEFKVLQKKLVEYRNQLEKQNQLEKPYFAENGSLNSTEIESEKLVGEQEHGANNSDTLFVEFVEGEDIDRNQIQGKGEAKEVRNRHSIDILKKKLKKVEKMLYKSLPGSKDCQKLRKKQKEYEKQISEQDSTEDIIEFEENTNRVKQFQKVDSVHGDALYDQPRQSWQRTVKKDENGIYSKEVSERMEEIKFKEAKDAKQNEIHHFGNYSSEKKEAKGPEPAPYRNAICTHYSDDEKFKKLAFLEEARQLKRDVLEKKRRESQTLENSELDGDEEVKKHHPLGESKMEENQNNLEDNEIFNYVVIDERKIKKQAYLEDARRLKHDTLEIERKEELSEKAKVKNCKRPRDSSPGKSSSEEDVEGQNSEEIETINYIMINDNDQAKKQKYLEEARRLRRDALEQKRKEEKSFKKKENELVKRPRGKVGTKAIKSRNSSEYTSPNIDDENKKQHYLEEAQLLKQEAMKKKSNESEGSVERQHVGERCKEIGYFDKEGSQSNLSMNKTSQLHRAEAHKMRFDVLAQIRGETNEQTECEQNSKLTPSDNCSSHRGKSNLQEDKKSNILGEQNVQFSTLSESTSNTESPSVLEEIRLKASQRRQHKCSFLSNDQSEKPVMLHGLKSKVEENGTNKQENNSDSFSGSPLNAVLPNILEEVKSNSKGAKDVKGQGISNSSTRAYTLRKMPDFLDEIRSRAKGENIDEMDDNFSSHSELALHRNKSNFLDEIKMKAKGKKEDEQQTNSPSVSESAKNFKEVKIKVEENMKQGDSTQFTSSIAYTRKPNLLDEIKSKAEIKKEEYELTPYSGSSPIKANLTLSEKKEEKQDKFSADGQTKTKVQEEAQKNASFSPSLSGTLENKPNAVFKESNDEQFEQTDGKEAKDIKSLKRKGAEATSTNQKVGVSEAYLRRRGLIGPLSTNSNIILKGLEKNEIRQKKLERSLLQNGIHLSEEIPYEEAKDKIIEITEAMKVLAGAGMDSYTQENEYFRLEEQLSKYTTALMLTDEYAEEHRRLEQDWEDSIEADNIVAIRKLRSHMPVNIRHQTEENLASNASPNGKILPKAIARKFKRTNILQLLRVNPDDIEMMHPSLLEGMRTTGLTLTERRALHEHFKDVMERWTKKRSDPSIERKWQWHQTLRSKFKETLTAYLRCVEQFGPPGSHQYAKRSDPTGGGCHLLGNQCALKADASMDYSDDYGYTKDAAYESSGNRSDSNKVSSKKNFIPKGNPPKICKSSEAELMQEYRNRLRLDANETDMDRKLLRELFHSDKRTKSLEKQVTHAGISLPKESISYNVAKSRVAELTKNLYGVAANIGNTSDSKQLAKLEHTYGELSKELDNYTNALMLTKEWAQEQEEKERQWEINISSANYEALQKLRRHLPVNIRNISESKLASDLTPNGKVLPKAIVKKFKRTNILMILRTDPCVLEVMHPSSLEAMRTTGLTLTERRAIHEHLKDIAPKWRAMISDKMCERKWTWYASLQHKFKEMLEKYDKHVAQYGQPGNKPCSKGDNPDNSRGPLLGIQCPIKADLVIDYSGDYGFPENSEYEQQIVAKSNLLTMEELEKRRIEDNKIN